MTLATVSPDGTPSARTVLLKEFDDQGFVFYTNYESAKARDLEANPRACLLFFWGELERQVRITGTVSRVSPGETAEYFQSRPRESQIGAWVSPQSRVIPHRRVLEENFESLAAQYRGRQRPGPAVLGRLPPGTRARSSSGKAARAACTIACSTPEPGPAGNGSGWRRSAEDEVKS